jgi:type IV pilus biogenesis protein CpaD/CtpE
MSRISLVAAMIGILALAGCASNAADPGPSVSTTIVHRQVEAPLSAAYAFTARSLREAAGSIAQGDMQAVHANIAATSPEQGEALRRMLIAAGVDPTRITLTRVARGPRRPVVTFTRVALAPSDCQAAMAPSLTNDPAPSMMNAARCRQEHALAAMVVDPADLVAPPPLGSADGATVAADVRTLRGDKASQQQPRLDGTAAATTNTGGR